MGGFPACSQRFHYRGRPRDRIPAGKDSWAVGGKGNGIYSNSTALTGVDPKAGWGPRGLTDGGNDAIISCFKFASCQRNRFSAATGIGCTQPKLYFYENPLMADILPGSWLPLPALLPNPNPDRSSSAFAASTGFSAPVPWPDCGENPRTASA